MATLLILGSKPDPALPPRAAYDELACANASGFSAARLGLPTPAYTVMTAVLTSGKVEDATRCRRCGASPPAISISCRGRRRAAAPSSAPSPISGPVMRGPHAAIASGERVIVSLMEPLPVHVAYLTAWMNKDGTAHFRNDVYGRDAILAEALLGPRAQGG